MPRLPAKTLKRNGTTIKYPARSKKPVKRDGKLVYEDTATEKPAKK